MLSQTTLEQVWARGQGSTGSGVRWARLGMQNPSLTSWVTSNNLLLTLCFLFCKRGIILLIHGITCILHMTTGHGKLRLLKARLWGSDSTALHKPAARSAGTASATLPSALAPASGTHFPSAGWFYLLGFCLFACFCFCFVWFWFFC